MVGYESENGCSMQTAASVGRAREDRQADAGEMFRRHIGEERRWKETLDWNRQ